MSNSKNKDIWFRHDNDASNDMKLLRLRAAASHLDGAAGWAAVGLFWALTEKLHAQGGTLLRSDIPILAALFGAPELEAYIKIMCDVGLLTWDGDTLIAPRLRRELDDLAIRRQRTAERVRAYRARKNSAQGVTPDVTPDVTPGVTPDTPEEETDTDRQTDRQTENGQPRNAQERIIEAFKKAHTEDYLSTPAIAYGQVGKLIQKRLSQYSEEQIMAAIDAARRDAWIKERKAFSLSVILSAEVFTRLLKTIKPAKTPERRGEACPKCGAPSGQFPFMDCKECHYVR